MVEINSGPSSDCSDVGRPEKCGGLCGGSLASSGDLLPDGWERRGARCLIGG
jgi:hypothetical protein